MIWLLKIELLSGAYAEDDWECEVEIESTATLEDLHFAIIEAVNFDNDHLYEFYISRTERSQDRQRFDEENGEIYNRTLESLYPLEKGKKLFSCSIMEIIGCSRLPKAGKNPMMQTQILNIQNY